MREVRRVPASTEWPLSSSRLISTSSVVWDALGCFALRERSRTRSRARSTTALSDNSSFLIKVIQTSDSCRWRQDFLVTRFNQIKCELARFSYGNLPRGFGLRANRKLSQVN